MKSIFSTQNLHTFFLRKYCRFPRGRPPGPPGPPPPGPPSRRPPPGPPCAPPEPPSRRGAGPPCAGACFCSSAMTSTFPISSRRCRANPKPKLPGLLEILLLRATPDGDVKPALRHARRYHRKESPLQLTRGRSLFLRRCRCG